MRFEYDAFARRTAKRVVEVAADGTETVQAEHRFVWDGHTVLHELDSNRGLTTWYWEPQTFTPVAKEQGGRKWSVASDHLGTPTEMYDELGQLAWKMQLDVFGVPEFEAGGAEDCPWRWPGQYEDIETGLSYNRSRYYSASDGCYIANDPIGLEGGLRSYGYVEDPGMWCDPFGLRCARVDDGILNLHNKFDPGSAESNALIAFVERWNVAITQRGGSMTRQAASRATRRLANRAAAAERLANPSLYPTNATAAGHIPDVGWGGSPQGPFMPIPSSVNSYVGGATQAVPRGTSYTSVVLVAKPL